MSIDYLKLENGLLKAQKNVFFLFSFPRSFFAYDWSPDFGFSGFWVSEFWVSCLQEL
jgi:hypothetical protein